MPRQQADAILDRVIHDAYGIELAGESMCKRRMSEPSARPSNQRKRIIPACAENQILQYW